MFMLLINLRMQQCSLYFASFTSLQLAIFRAIRPPGYLLTGSDAEDQYTYNDVCREDNEQIPNEC